MKIDDKWNTILFGVIIMQLYFVLHLTETVSA
jgi:hypothetical protein